MALTVGASVIWGTSFVAVSAGLQYSNPYVLLFERFLIATVAILGLGIYSPSARIWQELRRPETWILAAVWGAGFVLQFVGQGVSGAPAAALLSNLFIVFVPIAAFFVLKEQMTNSSKVAVALSVFGVVLVLPSGVHLSASAFGDLLLMGAALGNTMFIVLGKKYGISSLGASFAVVVSITVILAPIAATVGGPSLGSLLTPADWESALWLGIPCTVVATAMYTRGLASIRAVRSATLLLLEIIVGVVLSVALLGDALSPAQMVGGAVIAAAVLLSSAG